RIGESIPPDTRLLLERLGVWGAFVEDGHEPCLGSCSSWGDDDLGYNDFLYNPHGTGWHLDRRPFDRLPARQAGDAGAELWIGARFGGVRQVGGAFEIDVTSDAEPLRTVRTRFLVDASGSGSRVARSLGDHQRVHDRLSCLTAYLELPDGAEFPRLT